MRKHYEFLRHLVDYALVKAKILNKNKLCLKDVVKEIAPLYRDKNMNRKKRTSRPSSLYDTEREIQLLVSNLIVSHGWKRTNERVKVTEHINGVPFTREKILVYFIRGEDNGIN